MRATQKMLKDLDKYLEGKDPKDDQELDKYVQEFTKKYNNNEIELELSEEEKKKRRGKMLRIY